MPVPCVVLYLGEEQNLRGAPVSKVNVPMKAVVFSKQGFHDGWVEK